MSDEGKVTTERREHVLLIGLDRAAKRNAFDLPLYHALCQAYTDLRARRRPALRRAFRAWRPFHRRDRSDAVGASLRRWRLPVARRDH